MSEESFNKIIKTKNVNWKELNLLQPKELKTMSKTQLGKIKTSFKNNGFKSPFYVWEDNQEKLWCLDGHTRIPILELLESEGVIIPKQLPANFIECKDKKDAKKAVLIYNSHYSDIQQDQLFDFVSDLNLDELSSEIDIKDINIDLYAFEDKYTTDFSLPGGDKDTFETITFSLAMEQAETIKDALLKVKESLDVETYGNRNSNGNALYKMALEWTK